MGPPVSRLTGSADNYPGWGGLPIAIPLMLCSLLLTQEDSALQLIHGSPLTEAPKEGKIALDPQCRRSTTHFTVCK